MSTTYVIGQQSTHTATIYDDDGDLVDPSTVTFKVRTPAGVETSYVVGADSQATRVSVGVFRFVAPAYAASGRHVVRVVATSPAVALEQTFDVSRSAFVDP